MNIPIDWSEVIREVGAILRERYSHTGIGFVVIASNGTEIVHGSNLADDTVKALMIQILEATNESDDKKVIVQ